MAAAGELYLYRAKIIPAYKLAYRCQQRVLVNITISFRVPSKPSKFWKDVTAPRKQITLLAVASTEANVLRICYFAFLRH
jgi:hypothetical protein